MISSFMMGLEDEANVVYLVALSCSQKLELLGSCFYLILQLLYNEEIVHEHAILDWVTSTKEKISTAET